MQYHLRYRSHIGAHSILSTRVPTVETAHIQTKKPPFAELRYNILRNRLTTRSRLTLLPPQIVMALSLWRA